MFLGMRPSEVVLATAGEVRIQFTISSADTSTTEVAG